MIAPQVEDSPDRPPVEEGEPMFEDYAPLVDQRSDDFDDEDLGEIPPFDNEPLEGHSVTQHGEVEDETMVTTRRTEMRGSTKKTIKVSKYGVEYPSLPPAVVKRLAQNFAKGSGAKGKIAPDAMKVIMQASDWFFEQLGEDLQAYANHAGRKTIDESDVLTLMKRYDTVYHWVSRIRLHMANTGPSLDNVRSTRTLHHSPLHSVISQGNCCRNSACHLPPSRKNEGRSKVEEATM